MNSVGQSSLQFVKTVHFETVFTRESSLPVVVPQSRTAAKIDYVQITCGDVKRIVKSLKKTNPRAWMAFHQSF